MSNTNTAIQTKSKNNLTQIKDKIEQVLINGDLKELQPNERIAYYNNLCQSLGLNSLTRPFEYVQFQGKLQLYARRECAEQLRKIHGISIVSSTEEEKYGCLIIKTTVRNKEGREDIGRGVVPIEGLKPAEAAKNYMVAECVPLDSEILTKHGFKKYDELEIGEMVLAYDCESNTTKWTPLENVSVYKDINISRMFTSKSKFEIFCTQNHSWAVKQNHSLEPQNRIRTQYSSKKPDRYLLQADKINSAQKIILSAPETDTKSSLLTPIEAAILGWVVTDGTIRIKGNYKGLKICQSKEENFETIKNLVNSYSNNVKESVFHTPSRTFPMSGKTYQTKPQHWWSFNAEESRNLLNKANFNSNKDLINIVIQLNFEARQAMLEAMMLAEGDQKNIFANKDEDVFEAFQILSVLQGIPLGKIGRNNVCITQGFKKTNYIAGSNINLEDSHIGDVWCPTTKYGTWIMKQSKRILITGNTKAKRRATLSICGLGYLDESELDLIKDKKFVKVNHETGDILDDAKPVNSLNKEGLLSLLQQRISELEKLGASKDVIDSFNKEMVHEAKSESDLTSIGKRVSAMINEIKNKTNIIDIKAE